MIQMTARSTPSILLAEDCPVSRRFSLSVLKGLGYQADTAGNGREVLLALEGRSYDLVLMDIQMPEMDGLEATRIIRQRWPDGPRIIMVTSVDPQLCRDSCFDAGADDFLNKPVSPEELGAAIERSMACCAD
ncbi:MAG: response regulator [Methanothrix sp.]|nr:response regulator [Methanothrix sp.]